MSANDRELLKVLRQAFLMIVDVIERKLEMERTADLRKKLRTLTYEQSSCQLTDL